jgi:hypothetical protein
VIHSKSRFHSLGLYLMEIRNLAKNEILEGTIFILPKEPCKYLKISCLR